MSKLFSKRGFRVGLQLFILILIVFGTQFIHFKQMGFYEDDYAQVSPPLGWSLEDYRAYLKWVLTWPQGRPGQYFFTGTLGYIGAKLGGLHADYLLAFAILSLNTGLVFFLLRKLGLRNAAWVGALVFALFPADTTHPFLVHSFSLQPSLTFLLLGSLLYLLGRPLLAIFVSSGSLITYESPYPVFLALPLLAYPWDKKLPKKLLRHVIQWVAFVIVVIGLRLYLGEGRMVTTFGGEISLLTTLKQIALSFVIGPATALWSFIGGPKYIFGHWQVDYFIVLLAAGIGTFLLLLLNRTNQRNADSEGDLDQEALIRIILTALIMLVLAYTFSFTHYPPTTLYGRGTSVHLAASVGAALLLTGLYEVVRRSIGGKWLKIGLSGMLVVFLVVLSVYQCAIQRDYVQAWQNQQVFWRQVLEKAPDIEDGEVLAVLSDDLPQTRFILTHSWSDPLILAQIFDFPADWQRLPKLYLFTNAEKDIRLRTDGSGQSEILSYQWEAHWVPIPDAGLIAFDWQDGELVRQFGSWEIEGGEVKLKDLGAATIGEYIKAPLYFEMFGEESLNTLD